MATRVFTVWVSRGEGGAAAFDVFPPGAAPGRPGGDALYLTNDLPAFEGLFPRGAGRVAALLDLAPFAFPLEPADSLGALFAAAGVPPGTRTAEALWRVWRRMEERLLALPLWALEAIGQTLRDLDEKAQALVLTNCARQARAAGAPAAAWYASFAPMPFLRDAGRTLPPHSDCSKINAGAIAASLEAGGPFSRLMPGYESRAGQVEMARAVADALNGGGHLLVEAGTGVGKSLAYLLPAAAWARLNDVPVIISTNTRNLQTQLMEKDLPLVLEAFRLETGEKQPFRAVLLKGRSNYFCLRRLGMLLENAPFELDRPELRRFAEALAWLVQSGDGDLDTFAGATRCEPSFLSKVASTGEECPARRCPFYRRCFLQKARAAASRAHIVIVNHALVFAEAQSAGAILPPYAQIVFDEAHNLEEAATRHLSTVLSPVRISQTLRRLSRGKGPKAGGLLERIRKQIERSAPAVGEPAADSLLKLIRGARRSLDKTRAAFRSLFECLAGLLPPGAEAVRFRTDAPPPEAAGENGDAAPPAAPPGILPGLGPLPGAAPAAAPGPLPRRSVCRKNIFVPCPETWDEARAAPVKQQARDALSAAAAALMRLSDGLNQTKSDDGLPLYADLAVGVDGAVATLRELIGDLDFVWAGCDPGYVFWASPSAPAASAPSRSRAPDRAPGLAQMTAAPLSIAGDLNELLYERKASVVFCSATLRVGGSFGYISRRLGIDRIDPARVRACVAESPFNYLTQCSAIAPAFLPPPPGAADAPDGGAYTEQLAAMMLDVFKMTRGRAMGLFTSYRMMNQAARLLEEPLRDAGIRLLVHGRDGTRDQITRVFRSGLPAVLLGTHSFWEGVDVAGEALSCVVMARLPFSAVGDPVVEARCEQIRNAGGSAFREFSLPLAVIRFRQGFGRLIRGKSDKGAVIIADPRLTTKNYGTVFRKSLPCPVVCAASRQDLLDRLAALFQKAPPR